MTDERARGCLLPSFEMLQRLVRAILRRVYREDRFLVDKDVSERCVVARFFLYANEDWNRQKYGGASTGLNWDVEYNRCGSDGNPKSLLRGSKTGNVTSDLVLHQRGDGVKNVLTVEFKKKARPKCEMDRDRQKLVELTKQDGAFRYQYGLHVIYDRSGVSLDWYADGRKMIDDECEEYSADELRDYNPSHGRGRLKR